MPTLNPPRLLMRHSTALCLTTDRSFWTTASRAPSVRLAVAAAVAVAAVVVVVVVVVVMVAGRLCL